MIMPFVVKNTDGRMAVRDTEIGIDDIFGEGPGGRRVVFSEDTFPVHHRGGAAVVDHNVVKMLAGAQFGERPVHRFGRRSAPVLDLQAGSFHERFDDRFGGVGFHRTVGDDLAAFLFRRLD
ncbi:MAG: hypothetical protein ACXWXT_08415 [Candidatus Binatia bacterium]